MAKIITILTFFLLFTTQSLSFSPENPKNPHIFILLEDFVLKSSHSFNSLQSRGYHLVFKLTDDLSNALQRYGQFLYDGLIIFAPIIDRFGGPIYQAAVLEFVDSGRDLIVALDVNASDLIREIATESGVEFDDDPGAMVIDHTSYALSDTEGDHTLLASDELIQSDVILGKEKIEAPILFQGIGHSVNPANNLVLKVLSAFPSAYSAVPTSKLSNAPLLAGSSVSLVSIVQARNNARILISGSLRMFSDRFFRSGVRKAGSSTRFELIRHDVVEPPLLEVDQIYHLACPDSLVQYKHNPVNTIKTNVVGTLNILGLAKRVGATGSTAGMNPAGAPASTPTGSSALNRVAIAGSAVVVVMAYALMM